MKLSERGANVLFAFCVLLVLSPFFLFKHKSQDSFADLFYAPGFLYFFVPFLIVIVYLTVRNTRSKKITKRWNSGVFDSGQSFHENSLLEAYIRLGGLMLRKDTDDLKGKMTYLHRYFSKYFENSYVELGTLLKRSLDHPVDLKTIAPWLKSNLTSTSHRSQLIYFLAGLSTVDGSMNPKEKQYLQELSDLIGLTKRDFDSIMAMYEQFEDAYNDQFNQRSAPPPRSTSNYRLEKAYAIIGISAQSSEEELKKAYRSLAKKHHPDRFATDGEAQQAIAKERFVKIQQAYELILESRK